LLNKFSTRRRRLGAAVVSTVTLLGSFAMATPAFADSAPEALTDSGYTQRVVDEAARYPSNGRCSFAVLITARGVNAPGGSGGNGRAWTYGGHGAQLQPLVDTFSGSTPFPVYVESLAWDASLASGVYEASKNNGVQILQQEIQSFWDGCSTKPNIFLAGHSGGAHVIAEAVAGLQGSNAGSLIRGVVLYGDPSNRANQGFRAPDALNQNGVFWRNDTLNNKLHQYTFWGWSFDNPANPNPGTQYKIRSYCNSGDWACGSPYLGNWSNAAHNNYTGKTQNASDWFQYLVNSF
jgi:hypothetical protein